MHYDSIFQLQFDRRFSLISKRNLHKSEISNFDNLEIGVSVFRKKVLPLVSASSRLLSTKFLVQIGWGAIDAVYLLLFWNKIPMKIRKEAFEVLKCQMIEIDDSGVEQ